MLEGHAECIDQVDRRWARWLGYYCDSGDNEGGVGLVNKKVYGGTHELQSKLDSRLRKPA